MPGVPLRFSGSWRQRHTQRAAAATRAPAENVRSFLEGAGTLHTGVVKPTYPRGVTACDLGSLLPGELTGALRAGLSAFERKLRGYTAPGGGAHRAGDAHVQPVRLPRDENGESTDVRGVWPCGRGARLRGRYHVRGVMACGRRTRAQNFSPAP